MLVGKLSNYDFREGREFLEPIGDSDSPHLVLSIGFNHVSRAHRVISVCKRTTENVAGVGEGRGVNPLLRCDSSRKSKQSSCYSPNRSSTKPPHVFQQNVKIKGRDCVQVFGLNVKKKTKKQPTTTTKQIITLKLTQ